MKLTKRGQDLIDSLAALGLLIVLYGSVALAILVLS